MNSEFSPIPEEISALFSKNEPTPEPSELPESTPQIGLEFPINETLRPAMEATADQILSYSLDVQPGDNVLIKLSVGEYSHQFCELVMRKIKEKGANVHLQILTPSMNNNPGGDSLLMEGVTKGRANFSLPLKRLPIGKEKIEEDQELNKGEEIKEDEVLEYIADFENDADQAAAFFHHGPGSYEAELLANATKLLIIRTRVGDTNPYDIDAELKSNVGEMNKTLTDWRLDTQTSTLKRWCLIVTPTPEAPAPPGMTAEQFAQVYFEACTLDWEKVEIAQKALVELLSGKKEIHITVPAPEGFSAEWNSDITLETSDQQFANSVARQNMPGAEVFGAPTIKVDEEGNKKGTLNGVFAIPYPVWVINRTIPNIRLTFKDGKVTEWHIDGSEEDKAFFAKTLATDEGASIIGEIGFGTNKKVNIPAPDTLLAEKAFGIHLALGSSHPQKQYFGEPVQIDNGNRSQIHVDLPRLMLSEYGGGTMVVDGQTIFENGKYLDERLAVLNPDT